MFVEAELDRPLIGGGILCIDNKFVVVGADCDFCAHPLDLLLGWSFNFFFAAMGSEEGGEHGSPETTRCRGEERKDGGGAHWIDQRSMRGR